MKKQTTEYYLNETIKSLMEHDPLEIILFGSMAQGTSDESSDLDILVVLDNDTLPHSYEDRMRMRLNLRRSLRKINRQIPIDLLVYTKKEFELIKEQNSAFFNEVSETGKIVYEKVQ